PTQNAYIESFNGKFRDECLNGRIASASSSSGTPRSGVGAAWRTARAGR
ncbi:integrase core domain-containing protein, partial [Ralstonia pseudosolanacearum]